MRVVRAENLRNVSTEIFCVKEFWGKNYKKCQYWVMTFFAYRKEMSVMCVFQHLMIVIETHIETHIDHMCITRTLYENDFACIVFAHNSNHKQIDHSILFLKLKLHI